MDKPKHGGARKGAGRAPIQPGVKPVLITAFVTPKQRVRFKLLGGSAWLRDMINRTPLPPSGDTAESTSDPP